MVTEKVIYLKSLRKDQLEKWSDAETTETEIAGKNAILTVFNIQISAQKDLLIVQAFYPTWKFANYFSISRVGRIFAEGFFIESNGNIIDAEDSDLWPYR